MIPQAAINTLRIEVPELHRGAARAGLSRQLAALQLRPVGSSPASILLIRHLADPQPGSLRVADTDARAMQAWQRCLNSRVDALARAAVRPERGRVPAGADAILFVDDAELLACLTVEIARGDARHWWCRAVTRYFSVRAVFPLLAERIDLLPAVCAHLDAWQAMPETFAELSSAECTQLCELLVGRFEWPLVRRAWHAFEASRSTSMDQAAAPTVDEDAAVATRYPDATSPDTTLPDSSRVVRPEASPFDAWLRDAAAPRDLSRHLLMGIALGAAKAPAVLRSPAFARRLARWLASAAARTMPSARPAPVRSRADRWDGVSAIEVPALRTATRQEDDESVREPFAAPARQAVEPPNGPASPAPVPDGSADEWALDGVATELGGIFLLINVMEHLDLPGCFEDACGLASSVGAAGTLEALARVLAGTTHGELRNDAVWSILAALDDRDPHTPPRAEELRRTTRLPDAWRVWCDGLPERELAAAHAAAIETLRRKGWPPVLLDWLELAIPCIAARMAQACGLADVVEASRLIVELPARVYVTEAHVDVVASLESIRLPVRLAGLDRSPGWVRALQRVVLVHFE